jgi:hypothetical protein
MADHGRRATGAPIFGDLCSLTSQEPFEIRAIGLGTRVREKWKKGAWKSKPP